MPLLSTVADFAIVLKNGRLSHLYTEPESFYNLQVSFPICPFRKRLKTISQFSEPFLPIVVWGCHVGSVSEAFLLEWIYTNLR